MSSRSTGVHSSDALAVIYNNEHPSFVSRSPVSEYKQAVSFSRTEFLGHGSICEGAVWQKSSLHFKGLETPILFQKCLLKNNEYIFFLGLQLKE